MSDVRVESIYLRDTSTYSTPSGSTHLSVKGNHVIERADGTLVMPEFTISFSGGSHGPLFDVRMYSYDLSSAMDWAQQGLGMAEAVPHPFVSTPAGLANAGISMARGHYGEAGLSALTAVPILGMAGKVSLQAIKELIEGSKLLKKSKDTLILEHAGTGGKAEAQRVFDSLTVNAEVKLHKKGIRSAEIEGGGDVGVRDFSSSKRPTIQVNRPGEPTTKIRF